MLKRSELAIAIQYLGEIRELSGASKGKNVTARVWFDTEFTDLDEPDLLSVGLATENGHEFYIEIMDEELDRRCSDFVRTHVLPMFGRCGIRARGYLDLATQLAGFLAASAPVGAIELLHTYRTDRELLLHALERAPQWSQLATRIRCSNVAMEVEWSDVAPAAMEAVFENARAEGLNRHHALIDARALRAGHLKAEADPGVA